jgi:hypothetical protein
MISVGRLSFRVAVKRSVAILTRRWYATGASVVAAAAASAEASA